MHQDAHEFLNFLLNNIADTLQALQKKENENGKCIFSSFITIKE